MTIPNYVKPVEVTAKFICDPNDYLNFCQAENIQPVQAEFNKWVLTLLEKDLTYFLDADIELKIAK